MLSSALINPKVSPTPSYNGFTRTLVAPQMRQIQRMYGKTEDRYVRGIFVIQPPRLSCQHSGFRCFRSAVRKAHAATEDKEIRPFHVNFRKKQLADLRRRVKATRWPEKETVADASQGVQLATMQKLAQYWASEHDWRKCEAKINAVPNFITEIDGLDIHFIHVRSKHENALPMIVTHGWPGSIIEQMKIIEPLTDPTAHGGTAADAFHLVIPSLPGYGFSGKPTKPGWNPVSIAKAWATLMQRLGYTKYVAQGGDWGNAVSEVMALQQPPGLLGIHTNMAGDGSARRFEGAFRGRPAARRPVAGRKARVGPARRLLQERAGLRQRDGAASADAVRNRRFAGRPRGLDARSRHSQLPDDRPRLRRQIRRADAGRRPRQHHALLADEYRDLFGASLLGHRRITCRPAASST